MEKSIFIVVMAVSYLDNKGLEVVGLCNGSGGSNYWNRVSSQNRQSSAINWQGIGQSEDTAFTGVAQVVKPRGRWSSWSSFSACSKSCGGGIKRKTRTCIRPASGSRRCYGRSWKSRACNSQHCPPEPVVCMTEGCQQAANLIIDSMDTTVDPCDNFFLYSCGNWIKKNPIPDEYSTYDTFTKLADDVTVRLRGLIEEENNPTDPAPVIEARDMYKSCMNTELIDSRGVEPLLSLLSKWGGWPMVESDWDETKFDLLNVLTNLRKINNGYLVDMWVSADDKDSTTNIVQIDQPYLTLDDRDYYLLPDYEDVLDAYRTFMIETAVFLNGSQATVEQDVDNVIELEIFLANLTVPDEDRGDFALMYEKYSVGELYSNISTQFDWLVYLNKLFEEVDYTFTTESEVVVYSPVYLGQMIEKLQTTPTRTIANYLLWRITQTRIDNLSKDIRDIKARFDEVLWGVSAEAPRFQTCSEYVNEFISFAVGRLFVNRYFHEDAKQAAIEMIADIERAFINLLETVDWMDDETRLIAEEKAAAITNLIGFPDWINNDTALNLEYRLLLGKINESTYFENYITNLGESVAKGLERIKVPVDKMRWREAPSTVNAFYSPSRNQIVFPAGILQPPFWSQDRPKSMNLGGIGSVIAHEITHGFDDQGRQFDKDGNLMEWWSDDVITAFEEETDCMIEQYENYVMPQNNRTLDGINTLAENIADNGALRQAYAALVADERKNGPGPTLPGLPQFNSRKLFFLAFGQNECSSWRDEGLDDAISTGEHSPGLYRLIGPLSNFEEFSRVFQCPVGSTMNPVNKCNVW